MPYTQNISRGQVDAFLSHDRYNAVETRRPVYSTGNASRSVGLWIAGLAFVALAFVSIL